MSKQRRKTVDVADLVTRMNNVLEVTGDGMVAERMAVITFMCNVLHETGNYNGFSYIQVPSSATYTDVLAIMDSPTFDDSRRRYYMPRQ
jgi:hypothetical protein